MKTGYYKLPCGSVVGVSDVEDLGDNGYVLKTEDFCLSEQSPLHRGPFNTFAITDEQYEAMRPLSGEDYQQSKLVLMARHKILFDAEPEQPRWTDRDGGMYKGVDQLVSLVVQCLNEKQKEGVTV